MEHCDKMIGQEDIEVSCIGDLRKNEMLVSWDEELAEEEEVV